MQKYRGDENGGNGSEQSGTVGIGAVRTLSLIASRLLVIVGLLGSRVGDKPIEEIMMMCGTARKQSFYEARSELERAGFIQVVPVRGKQTAIHTLHPFLQSAHVTQPLTEFGDDQRNLLINRYIDRYDPTPTGSTGGSQNSITTESVATESVGTNRKCCNHKVLVPYERTVEADAPITTESVIGLMGDNRKCYISVPVVTESVVIPRSEPTESVTTRNIVTDCVVSLLDRCVELDGTDGSGDERVRTSPFQVKRRAQLPLVSEVWEKFIPGVPISEADKKRLLGWCDNSLEVLYDELEYVAGLISLKGSVEFPRGYALKTIQRRSEERKRSEIRTPSQETRVGAAAYREGEPLPEPEPVWLEESLREGEKIMKRLLAEKGWLE